jgi:hypothetical protein
MGQVTTDSQASILFYMRPSRGPDGPAHLTSGHVEHAPPDGSGYSRRRRHRPPLGARGLVRLHQSGNRLTVRKSEEGDQ